MTSKKKDWIVPNHILVPALNKTLQHFAGYCTDKWGEKEATFCRDLLPAEYRFIESDLIRQRCTTLRKNAKAGVDSVSGRSKRKKYKKPSGKYLDYLNSTHWKVFRKTVLEFWDYKCCLCNSVKKLEVHHRTYERVGAERLNDCVCLCQKCHRKVHGGMQDGHENFNVPIDKEAGNDEQYAPLLF